MRHRWFPVEEDMRKSILQARPILERCRVCGIYRVTHHRLSRYSTTPFESASVRYAPSCVPVKGPHRYLESS